MYNNPMYHNNFFPYQNNITGSGIKRTLFNIKKINWSNLLNNTQKTLNVINQAIPVYYQVKPILTNIKSFGRLMTAFNEEDNNNQINNTKTNENLTEIKKENKNSPTFFLD